MFVHKVVVGLIAESNSATIDPSKQFLRKMIDLKGCWYFNRSDWQEISDFIMDKEIQLEKISSHTFPISEAEEAFPLFDSGKAQKSCVYLGVDKTNHIPEKINNYCNIFPMGIQQHWNNKKRREQK